MGLITKEIEVSLGVRNIKHFENLGYEIPRYKDVNGKLRTKMNTKIIVKVEDLLPNSCTKVDIQCNGCGKELKNVIWQNYIKYVKNNDKYYCQNCAMKLYGGENLSKSLLVNNGISFEQWCINNNHQNILDRWDYDLNKCKPSEIAYGTAKKFYFRCPRRIHKSELKSLQIFIRSQKNSLNCKACNSFAQWGIDNICEDFLDKYWDFNKNNKLGIDPWEISHGNCNKKVYIICQEKDYHGSYPVQCNSFIKNVRCSYCHPASSNLIHPLDSLGKLLEDKELLHLWSDKNKKSPYEYAPHAHNDVYWKCPEGVHEDYKRNINRSNIRNFRCPECSYSKGEERISNIFIDKGFIKIEQDEFEQLIDKNKYNKNYYIPQMKFDGLVGLKGGLLSYDFYLSKYNLLIEYQGEQHEKYYKGFHSSKEDFEKQLEHDKRKKEYARNNNINLLEIWYYDFDNTEEILDKIIN